MVVEEVVAVGEDPVAEVAPEAEAGVEAEVVLVAEADLVAEEVQAVGAAVAVEEVVVLVVVLVAAGAEDVVEEVVVAAVEYDPIPAVLLSTDRHRNSVPSRHRKEWNSTGGNCYCQRHPLGPTRPHCRCSKRTLA